VASIELDMSKFMLHESGEERLHLLKSSYPQTLLDVKFEFREME